MTGRALVIDGDPHRRRLACEALTMFQPGFKVSSASGLEAASQWLEAVEPDLVVIDSSVAPADDLADWWTAHKIDARATVIFGEPPISVGPHSAIVDGSAGLSTLMETVQSTMDSWGEQQQQGGGGNTT